MSPEYLGDDPSKEPYTPDQIYRLVLSEKFHSTIGADIDGGCNAYLNRSSVGDVSVDEEFILPEDSAELLESYLQRIQNWLPILDRNHVHRSFYRWCHGKRAPSRTECATFYAIFALQRSSHGHPQSLNQEALRFAQKVQSLVPETASAFETGHVQALLILALYQMECDQKLDAWLTVGRALRAALLLQHRITQESNTVRNYEHPESDCSQYALLACFVLDTALAADLSIPTALRSNDLGGISPMNEDVVEEWEPGTAMRSQEASSTAWPASPGFCISTFNRLVVVWQFFNEVIELIRAPQQSKCALRTLRNRHIASDSDQPDHLRIGTIGQSDKQVQLFPQQFSLQLTQLVVILMTFEPTDLSGDGAVSVVGQLGRLVTIYSAQFDTRTVPVTWQPLLNTAARQIDQMRRCAAVQEAIAQIYEFVRIVSASSPAFDDLKIRYTTLAQACIQEVPSFPMPWTRFDTRALPHLDNLTELYAVQQADEVVGASASHPTVPMTETTVSRSAVNPGESVFGDALTGHHTSTTGEYGTDLENLLTMDVMNW